MILLWLNVAMNRWVSAALKHTGGLFSNDAIDFFL